MKHFLFQVQNNKHEEWRSWCAYLRNHAEEAKRTMCEENCIYERSIMYKSQDIYYVVGSSDFNGTPKQANLESEINKKHLHIRTECLGKVVAIFKGEFILPPEHEVLYEFCCG